MDSVQGFHAVMSLLLFPMWLLSGAFFPASGASPWLRAVMAANPLAYGLAALRGVLDDPGHLEALGQPALGTALAVIAGTAAATLALAVWAVRQPEA
jgi:ABC-type polysaccharide/polyol phosphate export permease